MSYILKMILKSTTILVIVMYIAEICFNYPWEYAYLIYYAKDKNNHIITDCFHFFHKVIVLTIKSISISSHHL